MGVCALNTFFAICHIFSPTLTLPLHGEGILTPLKGEGIIFGRYNAPADVALESCGSRNVSQSIFAISLHVCRHIFNIYPRANGALYFAIAHNKRRGLLVQAI